MGNEASVQAARAEEVSLVNAVRAGDLQGMESLLKQNPQLIHAHSRSGENIWHFVAATGNVQALQAVNAVVKGVLASQNKQDRLKAQVTHGFNQVSQAVNQVINQVAEPLPAAIAIPMQRDISINAQTRDGLTPLMSAVKASQPDATQQLLELGADAWRGDNNGCTALHHAAWQGELQCVKLLLQHADDKEQDAANDDLVRLIDITTNTGLTALHYTAWRGHCTVLKQLVNAGAMLAAPSTSDTMGAVAANAGSTPLHLAAMKGEVGVVRLLLRANVKLMALVQAEPAAAAEAAAASGALADIRQAADKYGKTAARLAWDMQRSDLGVILDPATPLDQAIELAAAAADACGSSKPSFTNKNLLQQRQPASAPVTAVPGPPALGGGSAGASTSSKSLDITGGMQRLGLGLGKFGAGSRSRNGNSSSSSNSSSRNSSVVGTGSNTDNEPRDGGSIVLTRLKPPPPPPPPSSLSAAAAVAAGRLAGVAQQQQQQQQVGAMAAWQHGSTAAATVAAAAAGITPEDEEFGGFLAAEANSNASLAVFPTGCDEQAATSAAAVHTATANVGDGPDPPADWMCPITNELMKDPVRACDGVAYEREAIEVWFQLGNVMFPGGHHRITRTALTPDESLQQSIAEWKATKAAAAAAAAAAGAAVA